MKIVSWNVNGVRAAQKKGFVDWLLAEQADIVCIQETKAHPDQLADDLKEITGYSSYWSAAEKKGYSGVGVFTREAPLEVKTTFHKRFDSEGRVLELRYPGFTLYNIYFPNGKRSDERLKYKMAFYNAILKHWQTSKVPLIICGDVNTAHKEIDLARPKDNAKVSGFLPKERRWLDKVISCGYVDVFREYNQEPGQYTYWDMMTRARDRNVGWRIDYFLASAELLSGISTAWIAADVEGSDHCPIGLDVDL
jgi:exodeoxyribonuclease-3